MCLGGFCIMYSSWKMMMVARSTGTNNMQSSHHHFYTGHDSIHTWYDHWCMVLGPWLWLYLIQFSRRAHENSIHQDLIHLVRPALTTFAVQVAGMWLTLEAVKLGSPSCSKANKWTKKRAVHKVGWQTRKCYGSSSGRNFIKPPAIDLTLSDVNHTARGPEWNEGTK
jgi:hypothetical protein